MNDWIRKIYEALEEARMQGPLIERSDVLTGFSGLKLMGSLQRLSQALLNETTCYVEVGVFQGLTLLSSALANQKAAF